MNIVGLAHGVLSGEYSGCLQFFFVCFAITNIAKTNIFFFSLFLKFLKITFCLFLNFIDV